MNNKVFFIADTHFGDSKIIKYENRPFADIYEMEEAIIDKWNKVIKPSYEVFVLGDFSSYEKDKTTEICNRLNGRKTLVIGNHDTKDPGYYRGCGFESVSKYPIIIDGFWMLSHEPLYVSANMPYANIYGHVHTSKTYSDYSEQSFCACIERLDYKPIEFTRVKQLMGITDGMQG